MPGAGSAGLAKIPILRISRCHRAATGDGMKKPKQNASRGAPKRASKGAKRSEAGDAAEKRTKPRLTTLETALGHDFADKTLLERALTHASAGDAKQPDNQRLEFLGDRVLALLTAEALLNRHPEAQEGDLAPRLNALVRGETCAEIAETLNVGEHLRMARSEAMTGGRRKAALRGDAMEALIAAVYLDGGLAAARDVFERHWRTRLEAQSDAAAPIDAKTALQEWAQARGMTPPIYQTIARQGPDHAPKFTVETRLQNGAAAEASGTSKRAAEQAAAETLLDRLSAEEKERSSP